MLLPAAAGPLTVPSTDCAFFQSQDQGFASIIIRDEQDPLARQKLLFPAFDLEMESACRMLASHCCNRKDCFRVRFTGFEARSGNPFSGLQAHTQARSQAAAVVRQ